jgi:hypothetical protein
MDFCALSPAAQAVSIIRALRCRLKDLMASRLSPLLLQDLLDFADFFLYFSG